MAFSGFPMSVGVSFIVYYVIIFIAALIGNVCVLIVCFKGLLRNSPSLYWYIGNLAAADLLFVILSIFDLIAFIDQWFGGNTSCKLQSFLIETSYTTSILTLVAISKERLKAVKNPLDVLATRPSTKTMLFYTSAIWFAAVAVCSPLIYAYSVKLNEVDSSSVYTCVNTTWSDLARQLYYTLHGFGFFLCPLLFMIYTHLQIYRSLRSRIVPTDATISALSAFKRQRKVFKILSVITGAFLACWCPFVVVRTLMYFNVYDGGMIWKGAQLLIFTSSAANPFIYGIYSAEFRTVLNNTLCCRKPDWKLPITTLHNARSTIRT